MLVRKVYKESFLPVKEWDKDGNPVATYDEPAAENKKVIVATKYEDVEVADLTGTGKKLVLDDKGNPVIEDGHYKYEDVEDRKIKTRKPVEANSWIEGWFEETTTPVEHDCSSSDGDSDDQNP